MAGGGSRYRKRGAPIVGRGIGVLAAVADHLEASLLGSGWIEEDVADVQQDDVVLLAAAIFEQTQVGTLPVDAVGGGRIAEAGGPVLSIGAVPKPEKAVVGQYALDVNTTFFPGRFRLKDGAFCPNGLIGRDRETLFGSHQPIVEEKLAPVAQLQSPDRRCILRRPLPTGGRQPCQQNHQAERRGRSPRVTS